MRGALNLDMREGPLQLQLHATHVYMPRVKCVFHATVLSYHTRRVGPPNAQRYSGSLSRCEWQQLEHIFSVISVFRFFSVFSFFSYSEIKSPEVSPSPMYPLSFSFKILRVRPPFARSTAHPLLILNQFLLLPCKT